MSMKIVSESEFLDFVGMYKGEIVRDRKMFTDPPKIVYHDKKLLESGHYEESIIGMYTNDYGDFSDFQIKVT